MMEIRETRGTHFANRKRYVESFAAVLKGLIDFKEIRYERSYATDEEFVRISDSIGSSMFLNITSLSDGEILKEVCRVVLCDENPGVGILPKTMIVDINKKREIAPLFR